MIAGDGPEREKIKSTISKYRLNNCQLVGFVDKETHKENFTNSDYMVMPSISNEGFGLVLIESINYGCVPILSQGAGGGKEWLEEIFPELIYNGSVEDFL